MIPRRFLLASATVEQPPVVVQTKHLMGISTKTILLALAGSVAIPASTPDWFAQQKPLDRLPAEQFDAAAPSALVKGSPGQMSVRSSACRNLPAGEIRRRIVNVAVQEWGFFGFSIVDETIQEERSLFRSPASAGSSRAWSRRPWWRVDPVEGARVASTIAGYWAATPKGSWMVDRQNGRWKGPSGLASRWRDPWSAAFVSWVMCEGGLGSSNQFRRSIAHHVYVDQAIRARDAGSSQAGFTAYDVGETAVGPGDLLCSSRRGSYGTITQRRRHLGVAARMHCDVVVKLEPDRKRILAIGGNVRGTVSLKLLPAALRGGNLAPTREIFAHLKLRADAIEDDALDSSPTARAVRGTLSSQAISTR